jgi:hypothetical protein
MRLCLLGFAACLPLLHGVQATPSLATPITIQKAVVLAKVSTSPEPSSEPLSPNGCVFSHESWSLPLRLSVDEPPFAYLASAARREEWATSPPATRVLVAEGFHREARVEAETEAFTLTAQVRVSDLALYPKAPLMLSRTFLWDSETPFAILGVFDGRVRLNTTALDAEAQLLPEHSITRSNVWAECNELGTQPYPWSVAQVVGMVAFDSVSLHASVHALRETWNGPVTERLTTSERFAFAGETMGRRRRVAVRVRWGYAVGWIDAGDLGPTPSPPTLRQGAISVAPSLAGWQSVRCSDETTLYAHSNQTHQAIGTIHRGYPIRVGFKADGFAEIALPTSELWSNVLGTLLMAVGDLARCSED